MSGDEKSKEWFLYSSVKEDLDTLTAVPRGDDPYDQYANMITVIEKSAYDRLKAENERLKKLLGEPGEGNRYRRLLMENERLKAQVEAYKKAKEENDERFQLQIGELRLEVERLKAENELLNKMVSEWATRAAQHCANTDRVKMHAEAMARSLYDADRKTPGQRKAIAAYRKDFPK